MSGDSILISPFGGTLVNLVVEDDEERKMLLERTVSLQSLQLSPRSCCDLELLATGAFSPLDRFMNRRTYTRVVREMRLPNGMIWPIPITLPLGNMVPPREGEEIVLRSPQNEVLALMTVEEIYAREFEFEANGVFGTLDTRHPLVAEMNTWGGYYVSGPLRVMQVPPHHDFVELRRTPAQVRDLLEQLGSRNVVAFQTRNPMHRAHEELTKRAAGRVDGTLLIHPVVGLTQPRDVDYHTRVRCYKALVHRYYDSSRTVLSLLPLAMRMGGPREAVWHAIVRRNFGANHFIVGRDHAGPGKNSAGVPFYGPYDAQKLLASLGDEIGVTVLPFEELVYLQEEARFEEVTRISGGVRTLSLSGTQIRQEFLANGRRLPEWFTRPEVAEILRDTFPPRDKQGFCVWFTGLSAAGKSTIAEILAVRLIEWGRTVTVLDGDIVRTHLSKGLGFSREDRDTNIRRIAFVASEIVRHRGVVICAAISPYRATRAECRAAIGNDHFIEVFIDTPLAVCEQRDPKGMYAKARRGEIRDFTGIDDPYEPPENPELRLTTTDCVPEVNADRIIQHLIRSGLLAQVQQLRGKLPPFLRRDGDCTTNRPPRGESRG